MIHLCWLARVDVYIDIRKVWVQGCTMYNFSHAGKEYTLQYTLLDALLNTLGWNIKMH